VKIRVSRVMVTQHVMIGHMYVLEGSVDLVEWTSIGPPFTADVEDVETEIPTGTYYFFRSREITESED
jgi:hypothetical protein